MPARESCREPRGRGTSVRAGLRFCSGVSSRQARPERDAGRRRAQSCETCALDGPRAPWHWRCAASERRSSMLMFKRSQLYIALALAALAEIIVRAVTR